jgi:predicted O-methyltransferase YrrM
MRVAAFVEQVMRHIRREVEIYAAFLVCLTLLGMEIFHSVGQESVDSAILVVLMLIVIGSLKDRNNVDGLRQHVDALRQHLDQRTEGSGVRWYARRREAEADMLADMGKYSHIVFIGVSQRSLADYLSDVLGKVDRGNTLPWRSLEVFFASAQVGEIYEGRTYEENSRKARQDLAFLLTDPRSSARIPGFDCIQFRQYDRFLGHSGSMFANRQAALNTGEFEINYVVHSRLLRSELRDGLTIRLAAIPAATADTSHHARLQYYGDLYRSLHNNSRSLGTFRRSLWDESAQEWSRYAQSSHVLRGSMSRLVELAAIREPEKVLELGAGSGETSEILARAMNGSEITLLDGSPQMLRIAREHLEAEAHVKTVLCRLPEDDLSGIDLAGKMFSLIVIHQAFPELVSAFGTIENLASWCRQKLEPNGRVIIEAHNTVIETKPPPRFENWPDPFLPTLIEEIKRHRRIRSIELQRGIFRIRDVEASFESQKFKTASKDVSPPFELSMAERQRMWRVPAVLGSIVDLKSGNIDELMDVFERVAAETVHCETMPRTSTYLTFEAV